MKRSTKAWCTANYESYLLAYQRTWIDEGLGASFEAQVPDDFFESHGRESVEEEFRKMILREILSAGRRKQMRAGEFEKGVLAAVVMAHDLSYALKLQRPFRFAPFAREVVMLCGRGLRAEIADVLHRELNGRSRDHMSRRKALLRVVKRDVEDVMASAQDLAKVAEELSHRGFTASAYPGCLEGTGSLLVNGILHYFVTDSNPTIDIESEARAVARLCGAHELHIVLNCGRGLIDDLT